MAWVMIGNRFNFFVMHYRTLSIFISLIVFLVLNLMALFPGGWTFSLGLVLVPVLIVYLAIRILRAPNIDQEPPPKYKWYDH